ncbi:MAG: hypothetical protein AAF489_01920 [Bacteroidota bacterium]
MKRFFKFGVSVFCLSLLNSCPPWAAQGENQGINTNEVIERPAPELMYPKADLI